MSRARRGSNVVLTVDLGTSSCKTALINRAGSVIGRVADEPYRTLTPHPGWAEQRPADWWDAVRTTVGRALASVEPSEIAIEAVFVDSQSSSCVALDPIGEPLLPASIHSDQRAIEQARRAESRIDRSDAPRAGPADTASRIAWLRDNLPETFARTSMVLPASGFLVAKMTGEAYWDRTQAAYTGLWDPDRRNWSTQRLDAFELDDGLFGAPVEPSLMVGRLTTKSSGQLGLPAGIPVLAGCVDVAASIVGMGATPGDLVCVLGTNISLAVTAERTLAPRGFMVGEAASQSWVIGAGIDGAGAALSWLAGVIDPGELGGVGVHGAGRQRLDELAAGAAIGSDGVIFFPHITGRRFLGSDPDARGAFLGLNLQTDVQALARAVVEGGAFAVRDVVVALADVMPVRRVVITGGGAATRTWPRVLSDVLGLPVAIPATAHAANIGGAAIAFSALDGLGDPALAHDRMRTRARTVRPLARNVAGYAAAYARYRAVSERLSPYPVSAA